MITHYFRTIKDSEMKQLESVRSGVWTHVEAPTAAEWEQLASLYALDTDILEDAEDFFEVPRLERSQGASYFFTRYPYREQTEETDTAPLLIVMGESFVLTITLRPAPPLERLFSGKEPVVTTQKTKLFIQIMDAITTAFDTELIRLRKAVHKDRVRLRKIGPREIERLVGFETRLNSMVDALIPTNVWLQKVTDGGVMQLYSDDIALMEDVMIDNNQVVNSARSILKTIQNIRSSIEAIMTGRLNNSLGILTVLTILLTVPLVVASLYGMNVALPLQDNPHTFIIIVLLNLLILSILIIVFRKKNWF